MSFKDWTKQTSTRVGAGGLVVILGNLLAGTMDPGAAVSAAIPAVLGMVYNDRPKG